MKSLIHKYDTGLKFVLYNNEQQKKIDWNLPVEIPEPSSDDFKCCHKQPCHSVVNIPKSWMENRLKPSKPQNHIQTLQEVGNKTQNWFQWSRDNLLKVTF